MAADAMQVEKATLPRPRLGKERKQTQKEKYMGLSLAYVKFLHRPPERPNYYTWTLSLSFHFLLAAAAAAGEGDRSDGDVGAGDSVEWGVR